MNGIAVKNQNYLNRGFCFNQGGQKTDSWLPHALSNHPANQKISAFYIYVYVLSIFILILLYIKKN